MDVHKRSCWSQGYWSKSRRRKFVFVRCDNISCLDVVADVVMPVAKRVRLGNSVNVSKPDSVISLSKIS